MLLQAFCRFLLVLMALSALPGSQAIPTGYSDLTSVPESLVDLREPTSLLGRHYMLAKRKFIIPLAGVLNPDSNTHPSRPLTDTPSKSTIKQKALANSTTTNTTDNGPPPIRRHFISFPEYLAKRSLQEEPDHIDRRNPPDVNYLSNVNPAPVHSSPSPIPSPAPVVPAPAPSPPPPPPGPPPPPAPPAQDPQYSRFAAGPSPVQATPPPTTNSTPKKVAQNKTKAGTKTAEKGKGKI